MESYRLSITSEIKGSAALRLFELGKREVSKPFLVPLYNEGICRAMNKSDLNLVTKVLRFTVSSCTENPTLLPIISSSFNSSKILLCLNAFTAINDVNLFRVLGECFFLFPTKSAVPSILTTWNKSKYGVSSFSNIKKSDKTLETAWGPMLAALGACAAADKSYVNFDQDIDIEHDLEPLYNRKNHLAELHNFNVEIFIAISKLFEEFSRKNGHYPQSVIWNGEIYTLEDYLGGNQPQNFLNVYRPGGQRLYDRIMNGRQEIDQLERQIDELESSLSAGNVLMKTSGNLQRYHAYLRQYAVIGLTSLIKSSYLDNRTKVRIKEHLETVLQSTKTEKRFRTFEIRLTSDTSLGELLHLMRTGIELLTQRPIGVEYDDLPHILNQLKDIVPNVFDFFSKYPLRLVLPEDKYKFYGVLSASRYDLERWTRFHGEMFIGEVEERYLDIDDLTRPNSMGISIFALQNLFVALPTLWHEYQHYEEKGVKEGNYNEMAVYTLENIFLRQLILDYLKKIKPSNIETEINNVLYSIRSIDPGACELLRLDFFDTESFEIIKNIIITNYPERQLTREAAELKAQELIHLEDNETIKSNLRNFFWHPEIKWPLLIGSNSEIYKTLNSILIKTFTQKNILSFDEWKETLSNPKISDLLSAWKLFSQQYSLDKYFEEYPCIDYDDNILKWLNRI